MTKGGMSKGHHTRTLGQIGAKATWSEIVFLCVVQLLYRVRDFCDRKVISFSPKSLSFCGLSFWRASYCITDVLFHAKYDQIWV